MSVVGIDFGTRSSLIAAVRRGGIDIVQNQVSSRQTPYVLFSGSLLSNGWGAKVSIAWQLRLPPKLRLDLSRLLIPSPFPFFYE